MPTREVSFVRQKSRHCTLTEATRHYPETESLTLTSGAFLRLRNGELSQAVLDLGLVESIGPDLSRGSYRNILQVSLWL